jgi:hypothetical protein
VHHDGSVTYAVRGGADRTSSSDRSPGHLVRSVGIEMFAASLFALARVAAGHYGTALYEVRAGIEWAGASLQLVTVDTNNQPWTPPVRPLPRYAHVDAEIRTDLPEVDFAAQLHDFATDMINQGGVTTLQVLR